MSQNCECRVDNGTESNKLNRIFANKENRGKRFGAPLFYLNSSHFFNKTNFEQYLLNENAIVTVRQIAVKLQQAQSHGGPSRAVPPKSLLVLPKQELYPPKLGLCPKESNRLGATDCSSRPESPKILVITTEFVSKNCFFADFLCGYTPEFVKIRAYIEIKTILLVFTPDFAEFRDENFCFLVHTLGFEVLKFLCPQNLFTPPSPPVTLSWRRA